MSTKSKIFLYGLLEASLYFIAFVFLFKNLIFIRLDTPIFILTLLAVIVVQIIKAVRLYIAFYGNNISYSDYIITYCKVAPISVIFPFKLGELYKIYSFGRLISNWPKSLVIILLDRFFDTLALVCTILFFQVGSKESFSLLVLMLFLFLFITAFVFISFPKIYYFWSNYLLHLNATPNRLKILRFLKKLNKIYCEIENVVKGRGMILLILSFAAWILEIGLLLLIIAFKLGINPSEIYETIVNYLMSAILNEHNIEMLNFTRISFVATFMIYCALVSYKKLRDKK